jgi:hypothetical protein
MEGWSRVFWAGGARPGMFLFIIIPADRGYAIVPFIYDFFRRGLGVTIYYEGMMSFITSPKAVFEKVDSLAKAYPDKMSPGVLAASMALQWGTLSKEFGYEPPFVHNINMAETITKSARKAIFDFFPKLKVLQYSFTNSDGMTTYECEPSYTRFGELGHHITEDLQFIEVVNPETGKWVKPGERGELVMTSLFRLTTPCIRFSTEDVFINEYTADVCECGRTHLRWLNTIPGRMRDLVKVKGKELLPWDVEVIVPELPDTTGMYQTVATDWEMDELELHLETTRKLPDKEYEGKITRGLEDRLGVPVKLSLHEIGTYPFRTAYKLEKFVDKRPPREVPYEE